MPGSVEGSLSSFIRLHAPFTLALQLPSTIEVIEEAGNLPKSVYFLFLTDNGRLTMATVKHH